MHSFLAHRAHGNRPLKSLGILDFEKARVFGVREMRLSNARETVLSKFRGERSLIPEPKMRAIAQPLSVRMTVPAGAAVYPSPSVLMNLIAAVSEGSSK